MSYIGASYFFSGILGSVSMSYVVHKSQISVKFLNTFTCVMNMFSIIFVGYAIIYTPKDGSDVFAMSSIFLFGFFNISYFTICYRHAASLTPRFGEAISSGLLNMMANLIGFIQTFVWAYFDISIENSLVYVLMCVLISLGIAILVFVSIAEKRLINRNNLLV